MSMNAASTEEAAREALATAHRIAVVDGLCEGTWNHFSLMLDEERMLITPTDVHWSQMTGSSLVLTAGDDDALARGQQFYIGYRIHAPLHAQRPSARCVLHAHPPYATALSTLEDNVLLPASQMSVAFHDRVGHNERYDLLDGGDEQGKQIAAALEDRDVLLLRGHGVVVVGPSVEVAYLDLLMFELACRTQVLAMGTGSALRVFSEEEAQALASGQAGQAEAERHFAAMKGVVGGS